MRNTIVEMGDTYSRPTTLYLLGATGPRRHRGENSEMGHLFPMDYPAPLKIETTPTTWSTDGPKRRRWHPNPQNTLNAGRPSDAWRWWSAS